MVRKEILKTLMHDIIKIRPINHGEFSTLFSLNAYRSLEYNLPDL